MVDIKNNIYDKIVWIMTVLLLSSLVIFEVQTWGKYIFLGLSLVIYLLYYMKNKSLCFPFDAFQKSMIPFICYTFLSAFWALSKDDAIQKGYTLFQIFFVFSLLYMYYRKATDIMNILKAIKWSGYIVSLYTINYFGINTLLNAAKTIRIMNEFANINTIGLLCSLAIIIQIFEILYNKMSWQSIMILPCCIVILATQSRKAFIFLIIGLIALYVLKNFEKGNIIKTIVRAIVLVVIIFVCYRVIESSQIFAGINKRMQLLLSATDNSEVIDYSNNNRNEYIEFGIRMWLKNPIYGYGIGSTHILLKTYLGSDTYTHNNMVELLSGGGIIGFSLFYFVYIYLAINLFKYRQNDYKFFLFGIIWLILLIFMDYGMVSYYSKSHWFYTMTLFLDVSFLKKKGRRKPTEQKNNISNE